MGVRKKEKCGLPFGKPHLLCWSELLKLLFQFVRRSFEERSVHAVIGLDRRGDVPVPHQHLNDLWVLLHLEKHRAVCMPERVKMEVVRLQAILLHQANERG